MRIESLTVLNSRVRLDALLCRKGWPWPGLPCGAQALAVRYGLIAEVAAATAALR